ncbi:polyphosphate kinase 2 [Croceibacterium aestuarii]|uniref:polyphosphate kinase 2 n=1 Tax=Croceibacterium aestuarii TaxID=3064139 RepID=UPI00272E7D93|nr:polyphosphate kinase 2 [Croceibacterium sp. D39]
MSKLDKKDYKRALKAMQRELVDLARWVAESGVRIVVLFEGRDSAGKGGVIGAIREHLNPRQVRVAALPKPDEREKGEWYFQRYVAHLPSAGEIVLFDRSWYNRAGVEKVMGFATEAEVEAFLAAAPVFEKLLTDDGIILLKYWLTCDQEKQEERFAERHEDPLKGWKLSPMDVAAREMYDEYTRARETMLKATSTANAPWTLVDFNSQKQGRLTLIRDLIDRIPDWCVPPERVPLPPLEGAPHEESFGVIEPLPDFRPET